MQETITTAQLYELGKNKTPVNTYSTKKNIPSVDKRIMYMDIWFKLNQRAADIMIEGNTFTMPSGMGKINIQRIKRRIILNDNGKPKLTVNWGKTKSLRKEGALSEEKFSFNTSKFICFYKWHTKGYWIVGRRAYKFIPSRSNGYESKSGLKNKLYFFLMENETNYMRFPLLNDRYEL